MYITQKQTSNSIYPILSCIILLIIQITPSAIAQNPNFSQFYAAPVFLNPALIGGEDDIVFSINQRTHTSTDFFPYSLSKFSILGSIKFENYLSRKKFFGGGNIGGWGATVYNETSGYSHELNNLGVIGSFSYFTQVSYAHFLSFGLQGGLIQKKLDFDNLTWGSQYHPALGFDRGIEPSFETMRETKLFSVINVGFMWNYFPEKFSTRSKAKFSTFTGLAISNTNRPNESFVKSEISRLPILYKLHGGFSIKIAKQFEIMPNYLILRQNKLNQINTGAYLRYYISKKSGHSELFEVQTGTRYRFGDSFIVSVGFVAYNIVLGLSYDFNESNFTFNQKGAAAFEISLSYRIIKRKGEQKRNISHPII